MNLLATSMSYLSKSEKMSFCNCLRGFKVPQGYSSNIKSLISMEDLKLMGLNIMIVMF